MTLLFEEAFQKTYISLPFSSHWQEFGPMGTTWAKEVGKYGLYFTRMYLVKK